VTFEARTDYAVRCFAEYGVHTDPSGRYAALYRPYHMIGLEVPVSIASAVLRGEPTGVSTDFHGDVMSVTKRALKAGETLDGEGGYMVYGRLAPAETSLARRALPIGLAHGVRVRNDVPAGAVVRWDDVEVDESALAVQLRRELEQSKRATARAV
jgi:predicted homoserine dehydrogenase-like protein